MWSITLFCIVLQPLLTVISCRALATPDDATSGSRWNSLTSRRDLWKVPVGAAGALTYGKLLHNAIVFRGIQYPEPHERRVISTIQQALVASIGGKDRLKVLEVGIGSECRLLRRGLYSRALQTLSEKGVKSVDITGVDIKPPSAAVLEDANSKLRTASPGAVSATLEVLKDSIESSLPFPDGYFDSIICCLTLCSVVEQDRALAEMKRLIRPTGGTFGYVEHVAVNKDEPYKVLEFQQQLLDPLQQRLVDNCHLHRFTEASIASMFQSDSMQLQEERFLVDSMWPVTCQCCGVIQRNALH